jgi:hypothetical protein
VHKLIRKRLILFELESVTGRLFYINRVIRRHDVFNKRNMFLSNLEIHWHTLALPKLLDDITRVCSTLHIPFRGVLVDAWVGFNKALAYVRAFYVARYRTHTI